MYKHNFIKVLLVTPKIKLGDPIFNIKEILKILDNSKASITCFPELSLTGYSLGDLFNNKDIINNSYSALEYFLNHNKYEGIVVLGMPFLNNNRLYNTAVVIKKNIILGMIPKDNIPNNMEYYEKRVFTSGYRLNPGNINFLGQEFYFGKQIFKDNNNLIFAVEICEDIWSLEPENIKYSKNGVNLFINISASNEFMYKKDLRESLIKETSRRTISNYLYVSSGIFESTSDTVFSGAKIFASNGRLMHSSLDFSNTTSYKYFDVDLSRIDYKKRNNSSIKDFKEENIENTFISLKNTDYEFEDLDIKHPYTVEDKDVNFIENVITSSLYRRLDYIKSKTCILGLSGGLDSTLALLMIYNTFKKYNLDTKNIIVVSIPSIESSSNSVEIAKDLVSKLDVTFLIKDIKNVTYDQFKLINHNLNKDITYENTQARLRTLLLMNLANYHKGIVVGTADMSEIALGFSTYNGDHMSMYQINSGLPKTTIKSIIKSYIKNNKYDLKDVLQIVLDRPISPELSSSSQKSEDVLGLYEINDFILYRFLSCGDDRTRIKFLLEKIYNLTYDEAHKYVSNFFNRFFKSQYKRQTAPDGPKIFETSLGSRTDYKIPSDIDI